jgi:hypothetical protein
VIPRRPALRRRGELLEPRVARGRLWCRRVDGPPPVPTLAPSKMCDQGAWHEWAPITLSSPLLFPSSLNRCSVGARASATAPAPPCERLAPLRPLGSPSPPPPTSTWRRGRAKATHAADATKQAAAAAAADTGLRLTASAKPPTLAPQRPLPPPQRRAPRQPLLRMQAPRPLLLRQRSPRPGQDQQFMKSHAVSARTQPTPPCSTHDLALGGSRTLWRLGMPDPPLRQPRPKTSCNSWWRRLTPRDGRR